MEIRRIHHPYHRDELQKEEIVLILGFFDGLHRGHQRVISEGVKIAKEKNLKAAVMTFNRHPGIVYRTFDTDRHAYLTPLKRKEDLMENQGIDILYEVDFTSKLGRLSPQDFVDQYMVELGAKVVVAGFDYTYGTADKANMDLLPKYAQNRFEVVKVEKETEEDEKISSTRIRQCISEGYLEEAHDLLGYYYETSGFVIHGDARGRELGYPTANIYPHPYVFVPRRGVYAVKIQVNGSWYDGMASIGYNVTFKNSRNYSVEVHIFDFKEEIYGEDVRIKWIHYLREEIKFDSADGLIEQLEQDEIDSREILETIDNDELI